MLGFDSSSESDPTRDLLDLLKSEFDGANETLLAGGTDASDLSADVGFGGCTFLSLGNGESTEDGPSGLLSYLAAPKALFIGGPSPWAKEGVFETSTLSLLSLVKSGGGGAGLEGAFFGAREDPVTVGCSSCSFLVSIFVSFG